VAKTVTDVRVDFPGLLIEAHRNGSPRIRVRVEGRKSVRINIPVGTDHPDFAHYYHAARAGEVWEPPKPKAADKTLDDLCTRYLAFLENMADAGQASPATLKQRRSVLTRLCDYQDDDGDRYGSLHIDMPAAAFVEVRDAWAAHPGAADNLTKTIRAIYRWAMERDEIGHNPAAGIGNINRNPKGGAVPWTAADIRKFKEHFPPGTTAHLWLTLQAFTACRIGDALWLGRGQEMTRGGQIWLDWQPQKKGSAFVSIPMLPPLFAATRKATVVGPTYLLSEAGRPFPSVEALRVRVQRWCTAAGLPGRSSHGIRKAVGDLMAEAGCSQHQIMSVMAHTQAKTSERYTKGADRRILAADGMQALAALDW
jgi:integrase